MPRNKLVMYVIGSKRSILDESTRQPQKQPEAKNQIIPAKHPNSIFGSQRDATHAFVWFPNHVRELDILHMQVLNIDGLRIPLTYVANMRKIGKQL